MSRGRAVVTLLAFAGVPAASAMQVPDTTPFLWGTVSEQSRLRLRTTANTVVGRYDGLDGPGFVLLATCERGCRNWGMEHPRVPVRAIFTVDLHQGSYWTEGALSGSLVGLMAGAISGTLLAAGNQDLSTAARASLGALVGSASGAVFGAILGAGQRKWIPLGRAPRAPRARPAPVGVPPARPEDSGRFPPSP